MLECLIVAGVLFAAIYFATRLLSINSSMENALERKLDELEVAGYDPAGHDPLRPFSYRILAITAPGFENHTLIEVCDDDKGYVCYHYDPNGLLVGEKYVEFKP